METVYKPDEGRISVAEAKRLILSASPDERVISVYLPTDEKGDIIPGADFKLRPGTVSRYAMNIDIDLPKTLVELGIEPRLRWRLPIKDYSSAKDDDSYFMTHEEFVRLAKHHDVAVLIGEAPAKATPERFEAPITPVSPEMPRRRGLPTAEIAHCFAGLQYTEEGWRKPLGDGRQWLGDALAERGARPNPSLWWPVKFAAAIHKKFGIAPHRLRGRFQSKPALRPWLEAWLDYEAANIDTGH